MVRYVLMTSVFCLAIALFLGSKFKKSFEFNFNLVSKTKYDLVIGILSAREHFEEREILRSTWMSDISSLSRVKAYFVIGDSSCSIHPDNRIYEFGCEGRHFDLPENPEYVFIDIPHRVSNGKEKRHVSKIFFKIMHPVVLKRFVFKQPLLLGKSSSISIKIQDGLTEEDLMEVTFNNEDIGILQSGHAYQTVAPMFFQKGFEGIIVIEGHLEEPGNSVKTSFVNATNGIIHFTNENKVTFYDAVLTRNDRHDSDLFMVVSVQDFSSLKQKYNEKEAKNIEWNEKQDSLQSQLLEEETEHSDLLFVPLIDVYRNLPKKLLLFHQWVGMEMDANFIMKTDDDCYVNINQVLNDLYMLQDSKLKHLWWGSFRDNWFVERGGKWAEPRYTSSEYPRFACGVGNVMDISLHQWITHNADHLQMFQGEDVSMAIWLSAVPVSYVQDERWSCDNVCHKDLLAVPQLIAEELQTYWKNQKTCGNPCNCTL